MPTPEIPDRRRPQTDMTLGEAFINVARLAADLLKLKLELRRRMLDEKKFSRDLDKTASFFFTLHERAEQPAGPGEAEIYAVHEDQSRTQIGLMKQIEGRTDRDLVILNNGDIFLIGPNEERESEASMPYRQRVFPRDVANITYKEDGTITDKAVDKVRDMFDSQMQADILLSSKNDGDWDHLYPLVLYTFQPHDKFLINLNRELHEQKAKETAEENAGQVIRAAEFFIWDATLDRYNSERKQQPPTENAA